MTFKKRLKEESFKTTWHSSMITHSLDAVLIDDIAKIIEEARKEFPYVDHKEWLDPLFLKEEYHYDGDITRVIAWFVKWFGEGEKP